MKAIKLNQVQLLCAISDAVSNAYREETLEQLPAMPRVMNAIIESTNKIISEIEKGYIEAVPGMSVNDWFSCDDVGVSSAFMVYYCLPPSLKDKLPFSGVPEIIFRKKPEQCEPKDTDDLIRIIKAFIACQNVQWNFRNLFDVAGITDLQRGIVHHIGYLVNVYQADISDERKYDLFHNFRAKPLGPDYFNEEIK